MIYLANVNVLLALAWPQHAHHGRTRAWWNGMMREDALATCSITELGFVRISLQMPIFTTDIVGAKQALAQLRAAKTGHLFLLDELGADALPAWVKTAKQTTDGHLFVLATRHHAKLATLDTGIPGAVLV